MVSIDSRIQLPFKRWFFLTLLLFLLMCGCRRAPGAPATTTLATTAVTPDPTATGDPPTPASTPTAQMGTATRTPLAVQSAEAQRRWREDLQVLVERAKAMHPDLTYRVSEEEFAGMVAAIEMDIPFQSDNQVVVDFMRLMALSDGHSRLQPHGGPAGFGLYDLQLYQFGDELFVVDAADSQQEAIGARLVGIGDLSVDEVRRRLEPLVAHENEMFVHNYLPLFAVTPEVLEALDIVADPLRPGFVLEDGNGARFTLDPPILSLPETLNLAQSFERLLLPQRAELLYLSRHQDERFWYSLLEEDNTFYVQYNRVLPSTQSGQNIHAFVAELDEVLQGNEVSRVVLDLRHNMGGELGDQARLLQWLQAYSADHPGTLFVLIGRQTFSAGSYLTSQLETTTDAVLVGEPTGSRPNFYANSRPILLPNSQMSAHVSTHYFEPSAADDERPWIAPHISAPPSAAAYFAGRDPALEAIR